MILKKARPGLVSESQLTFGKASWSHRCLLHSWAFGKERESWFWCGTCYTCKPKYRRTEKLLSHVERNICAAKGHCTSLTPLCGSWLWTVCGHLSLDCLYGKIYAVQAQRHTYSYHISSGWSIAKDWQFAVYSKRQTSPSLPYSFDSLPVSLNRLMLTSNFLFLFSRTLAAIRLLVCSCHFFSAPFSMSVIPAFNHPLIHTSYKQTSPLLLLCCP